MNSFNDCREWRQHPHGNWKQGAFTVKDGIHLFRSFTEFMYSVIRNGGLTQG